MAKNIILGLCIVLASTQSLAATDYQPTKNRREAIKDQFVLAFASAKPLQNVAQFSSFMKLPFLQTSSLAAQNSLRVLLSRELAQGQLYRTQVLVKRSQIGEHLWSALIHHSAFLTLQPNYRYIGEYREDLPAEPATEAVPPNDAMFAEQYHHPVMKNLEAWDVIGPIQKPIVVAVTDDGVDLDHEDLKDAIYHNPKEIPGNGVDDDNNGYVDDIAGWDFALNDNDPRPTAFDEHGTHVAGIIAATADNHIGIAGTAAAVAKIMPIRFYGGQFTSEIVADAYKYAADNGAHIITTSYNIDGFVGDQVFEDAVAYVYQKGVMHFNSAGNSGQSGPRRGAFKELILVCSTIADGDSDDVISNFSNYGPGVDICAPGGGGTEGILSTVNANRYDRKSGTSMASPNAAAVAALIWAKNPKWNRDQVAAQLYGTAKNIDGENPNFVGKVGQGRVDSLAGVSSGIKTVAVTTVSDVIKSSNDANVYEIKVTFSNVLDPKTVVARHFKVLDGMQTIGVELVEEYKVGSNEVILRFEHSSPVEKLLIEDFVRNPFGEAIDGDGDGLPGGDYVVNLNQGH